MAHGTYQERVRTQVQQLSYDIIQCRLSIPFHLQYIHLNKYPSDAKQEKSYSART